MRFRKTVTAPQIITTNIIQPKDWNTLYNGYGYVKWDTLGVTFAPKASTAADETHAGLILSNKSVKDFAVKIKAKTIRQLRTPTPNAWECTWFIFNYVPTADGFKTANYIILKTNGVEVGTMDSSVGQKFLFTSSSPTLKLNTFNFYEIIKTGKQLQLKIDGVVIFNKTLDIYDQLGQFGLYSEDAECLVESVL